MKMCLSFNVVDIDVDKDNQIVPSRGDQTALHCSK